jgi:predicted MFS family arabinose efflux permease
MHAATATDGPAPVPTASPREPRVPWEVRPWRIGVLAHMVDALAVWALSVAGGYMVLHNEGSATAVAVLAVAGRVPAVVLAAHSGTLADAFDVRVITRWLAALQALPAIALCVAAWDGDVGTYEIYAGVFAISLLSAAMGPCMQLEVGSTLPLALRRRGRALNNASGYAAGVIGAVGGGWLVGADGPRFVFGACAVAAVAVALVFARFDAPERPRIPLAPVSRTLGRVPRPAWWLVSAALLLAFTLEPLTHLAPVIAQRHGSSAGRLGLYVGAIVLGALFGGLLFRADDERAVPVRRALPLAMGVAALALVALAAWPTFLLALATMVLAGACWEVCALETLLGVIPHAPDRRVGFQVGIWLAATGAGAVLGTLLLGWTMDAIGVDVSLYICAGLLLSFALVAGVRERNWAA